MRNELIKDLELAKEVGIVITTIENDNTGIYVCKGIVENVESDENGHLLNVDGNDFLITKSSKVAKVRNGNNNYYSVIDAAYIGWNLNIII